MSFTYQLAHQHQNLPYTRMMMIKPQTMIEHQLPASNKHQSNMFNSNHDHHLQQIYQRQQLFNMNNNNNNHYDNNQSIIKLNQHYLINNNNNYDSTAVQEIKMKKLRLLKEQICKQRQENRNKCNELETFKLIFKQKENELSIALNKIDTLTKQLDDIIAKNNNHNHNNNASSNPNIAIQLANLKQELLFKTNLCKQNDEQLSRKQNLLHKRQSDMICIDQRIKDLQCRLLRKKIINHKLKLLQQQSNHSNDDYKQNGHHQSTFKQIAMGQISDGSNPINNRESFERLKMDHSLRYSFSNTANNQRPIQTTKQKANHSNGSNSNDDINKELQKNRIDLNASLKNEKISVIINEDDDEDVMMMMMMKNDHHHNVHNLEERPSPSGSSGSSDRISSSLNTYANIDDSSPEHDHSNKSNCRHLQLNQMISSKSDDNRNAKLDKLSSKTIDFHQPDKNNTFSHRFISIAKCNTAKNNHHLDESIGKSCTTSNKPAKLNANAISDINNKDLQESMQHDDDDNININNNNNNNNSNNDSNDNDYENNNNNNNGNSNNNNNNTNIYNNDNNENTATQQNDDSIVSEENRIEGNRSDNNEPPNNGIVNKSNNLSSDESWKMMKRRPVYNLKEMENELLQLSSAHKQNQCTNDYCHDTIDHSVHITTNNNTTDAQQIVDDCLNNNSFSSLKLKTNLKKDDCQNEQQQQQQPKTRPKRVSFDPLALLLDASLEGELELVKKTAGQVLNPSASNDEGITPLHNATCAGHLDIVKYLVEIGCDVNVQDSDGWTPLHCAASCNNLAMIKFLVKSGACIFATTFSDMETAAEKCEEEDEGFDGCCQYLYGIQDKLGVINNGIVYALYDYDAVNHDELTFKQGQPIQIIRKGDDTEKEWWWAKIANKEGYIPRNLIGLYPRVKDLCHQSVSSN